VLSDYIKRRADNRSVCTDRRVLAEMLELDKEADQDGDEQSEGIFS
jgi:hypothetical protein